MTDYEFLIWIRDRLINVYGESENVDFVRRLKKVANNMKVLTEDCFWENEDGTE